MSSSLNSILNSETRLAENEELRSDLALISVIIPCYNHGRFLRECVESVISQTYKNWECIIVNDGSTDKTTEEVRALIQDYKNYRIFLIEKQNTGVADSRNAGVEKSKGDFVLFLDADDKIHQNFLEEAINILQSYPEVGFVYTDIQHFGVRSDFVSHGDFNPRQFLRSNQATVSSLFRKQIYAQVGGFKKEMEVGLEDWEFWVSAYEKKWQGYRLAKAYLYYRQHSAGSRLQNLLRSQVQQKIQFAKIISFHYQLYEAQEIAWAKEILSQQESLLAAEKLEGEFIADVENKIDNYQQNFDDLAINELRQIRQQIADAWLSTPSDKLAANYAGTLGKVTKLLLKSGLKFQPLTDSEKSFVEQASANLTDNFKESVSIKYLLAAMLYRSADQLSMPVDISLIPEWFLSDYLKFVLQYQPIFQEIGEVESYDLALKQWVNYLHNVIISNPDSFISQEIALKFAENANFSSLIFREENLKEFLVKRSEIIEYFLKTNGPQLDWEFPTRTLTKKIRLGILAAPLIPSTETFVSLPVYEYISREFEVILYSFTQTYHSLERYCQSCANSFKILPINLKEAVNLIRNDELDILYIAADITTVINPICLLAAHRLARVQITNIASSFPTGIQQIDYYIVGEFSENYQTEEHHNKLFKIDNLSPCFSYGDLAETASFSVDIQSLGLSENRIVFVSAANFFSLTPEVVETWAKIIAKVNDSVLLILPFTQKLIANYIKNAFSKSLKNQLNKNQISSNRLIILDPPNPNREDIKNCLKIGNIYLDTMFFSESQGIIEALEIGLPVITKQGDFRDSIASSLLQALEVTQLIADSEETYIEKAVNMANNANLLQNTSEEIKQKMQANPLFLDSRSYAAKLELMFKNIIQQYDIYQLTYAFKLRDINLVLFPDWNQSEDLLFQDLANAMRVAINHPQKHQITMLIDTTNIAEERADLTISSIVMELLMSEDLDVEDGPEISLFGNLSKMQWQMLLPKIHARIILENENQQTLAEVQTHKILTAYTSDGLSQTERL